VTSHIAKSLIKMGNKLFYNQTSINKLTLVIMDQTSMKKQMNNLQSHNKEIEKTIKLLKRYYEYTVYCIYNHACIESN
jgi:hypothetical protein